MAKLGNWSAQAATPTLPAASSVSAGDYFLVSEAGCQIVSGISTPNGWAVGDKVVSNGSAWYREASGSAVSSVGGVSGPAQTPSYFVEVSTSDQTITMAPPSNLTGKQAVVINASTGALTVSGSINGGNDCVIQSGTSLSLVSDGATWRFAGKYYVSDGWGDITPIYVKDDGANAFTFGLISGVRYGLLASNTNPLKRVHCRYHIPHTVALNQSAEEIFLHLHWESLSNAAGNIIITARISAGLRDGTWFSGNALTYTLTPSIALSSGKQIVTELPLPAGFEAYLVPDALFDVSFERNRGANATDTYNDTFVFHTADLHIKLDGKQTTTKDPAWIKV